MTTFRHNQASRQKSKRKSVKSDIQATNTTEAVILVSLSWGIPCQKVEVEKID